MSLADLLAGVIFVALNAYALLGGADYGGGVWDLLAGGPRKEHQRELIAEAIGPVWEANHVWLILALVLLFTCFPPAFARLGIVLHIPLSLVLIGIVLRGSAFTFWRYGGAAGEEGRRWGVLFAVASLITPLLLGTAAGAIASGGLGEEARGKGGVGFYAGYVAPWLTPFALSVGVFALVAFAFLAGVYLTLEARDAELQEDFRRRALGSGVALFGAAFLVTARIIDGKVIAADLRARGSAAAPPHGHHCSHGTCRALVPAVSPRAALGRRAGLADSVGLGAQSVPLHPATRPHDRRGGGAPRDAPARARRARARCRRAVAVAVLSISGFQTTRRQTSDVR